MADRLSSTTSGFRSSSLNPTLLAESLYFQEHPIIDHSYSILRQPYHQEQYTRYTTVYQPSFTDQAGTAIAKAALSGATGIMKRISPGVAPGLDAATYGINANLDRDLEARSTHTTSQLITYDVPDPPYYEYIDPDPQLPLNPYNS